MTVKSLFQRFTSVFIGLAVVFGFLATPAFADVNFSAINGANTSNQYFVVPTGIEVGVIYSDDNQSGRRVLMCNNAFGQPGTGPEWQSTCTSPQPLRASTRLRVQAYTKPATPGSTNWRCAVPNFIPTPGGFQVNWSSPEGQALGNTIVTGPNLIPTGLEPCKSNGLPLVP